MTVNAAAQKPASGSSLTAQTAWPVSQPWPVALRGKMTPHGYEPENGAWVDYLTKPDDETRRTASTGKPRRIGINPLDIPPAVLTAAGHGPRRTARIVAALGDEPHADGIKRHKDLCKHCLTCAENSAEVRRCAIVDCPLWVYRMGKNPHDPRRGRDPFSNRRGIVSGEIIPFPGRGKCDQPQNSQPEQPNRDEIAKTILLWQGRAATSLPSPALLGAVARGHRSANTFGRCARAQDYRDIARGDS